MASATLEKDQRLQECITCGVCKEILENPKLLPCHHSFCLKCVGGLVRVKKLSCPECRKIWEVPPEGPSALQADFKSNTLKEILADKPQEKTATCEHHPDKPLELFCKEDSHTLCLSCVKDHDGHSLIEISEAVKLFDRKWVESKEEKLQAISVTIKKVEKDKAYFENENKRLREELELDRIRVIDTINNQFSSLQKNIDEYHQREYDSRVALEEEMQTSKAMIETFTTHLETIQDNVEKIKLFVGLTGQGLFIPEHSPVEPYKFKPCEILHNRIIFGSLYHQSNIDESTMVMSMLHHPLSMLPSEVLPTDDSDPTPMSILSETEAMSISSGSSMVHPQPEMLLSIQAPRYLSKPTVRKKTFLRGKPGVILGIAEIDSFTHVVTRLDQVEFYKNLELTDTINVTLGMVAITPDRCLALTNKTGVIQIYSKEGVHKRDIETHFTELSGIACNDNGELVVCDRKTNTVSHIDYNTGTVVTTTPQGLFEVPWYVAVNHSNDVVLSDLNRHCITVIDRHSNKKMEYGTNGSEDGQLSDPMGLCTDVDNIIVADFRKNRVSFICSTGHLIKHLLTEEDELWGPLCVAIDHQGHLLVGDGRNQLFEVQFKE